MSRHHFRSLRFVTLFAAGTLAVPACRSESGAPPGADPSKLVSVPTETSEAALHGPTNFTVTTSFNTSPIAKGSSIWFNCSVRVTGIPGGFVSHLYFTNQTVDFAANGTSYDLPIDDATITFDHDTQSPSTHYDGASHTWRTQVSAAGNATIFLSGLSWHVPQNLPGNISPVTWNATATSDHPGTNVRFTCGAAVYHSLPTCTCTPKTCAQVAANCGSVPDGCGGTLTCGTCSAPQTCGGGNVANVCGVAPQSCTGLCTRQVQCNPGTTSISGTAYAPTDPMSAFGPQVDPIPNAIVYVPNGPVGAFMSGPSCDSQCGGSVSGSPLVLTQAGWDGTFTLQNVPAGANIPLVIQSGKWRRQITIPYVTPCQDNPQPASLTRLPRTHAEGDIPLVAMVTGNVDTLECVLLKMGIDQSEFTGPSGGGRVHMYVANGQSMRGAVSESALYGPGGTINNYDYVLFACEGAQYNENPADQQRVINYANMGGRVLATHYSYVWLYNDNPFQYTGSWDINQWPPCNVVNGSCTNPLTAAVDMSFPNGVAFANWLHLTRSDNGTLGQVSIEQPRHDLDSVNSSYGQQWIYDLGSGSVQHYTFVTPVGSSGSNQCGRVIYSDFHVNNVNAGRAQTFPKACTNLPMSGNDRIMEYMLFDLGSCIHSEGSAPQPPPSCTPAFSCNGACGQVSDGCGGTLDCGSCSSSNPCASLRVASTDATTQAGTPQGYEPNVVTGATGQGGTDYTGTGGQGSASMNSVPPQSGCANVVCPAADQCHFAGSCDPTTGLCSNATPKADGTTCNDGNACNRSASCQSGMCIGSNPVVCTASDQCHAVGTCNPATGVCSNPIAANNTACSTGNPCTHGDSCQNGTCNAGAAVTCTAQDQCHSAGVCQNVGGAAVCTNPVKANGSACNDGNACTQSDVCTNGICAGTAYACAAADQCHQAGMCNGDGTCTFPIKVNGTACNDGNACTQNDACTNGSCAGSAFSCAAPDQCHQAGTCNGDGTCTFVPKANGTACNDGNACTQNDVCTNGTCAGTAYTCNAPNQCQQGGTCNGDGTCTYQNKANGTTCNDGNACTQNDVCTNGSCAGVAYACALADQCHQAGTCNGDGTCSFAAQPNGTACNDGNACTRKDICTNGTCAGTAYTCAAPDQCHLGGSCNGDGTCSYPNKPDNTACNDGNACTSGDLCTAGNCAGTPYTCAPADQCHNPGTCNGDGTCTLTSKANGTACNANCSANDSCNNGVCGGTCAPPDQCHQAGVCTAGGGCSYAQQPNGTVCNDHDLTTANDVCNNGVCKGTPIVCAPADLCHQAGVPNGVNCTFAPKADGTACNDGNRCTTNEVCMAGVCTGTPVQCAASDQCHSAGTCDPGTGRCTNPNAANGTLCNPGNLCVTVAVCTNGSCNGSPVQCQASDQCHQAGTCNPATGTCSNPTLADGTVCNDGNACTLNDVCTQGVCSGKAITCTASDGCHVAGTCNPATGTCSNPAAADGTACSDGNLCFTGDTCHAGSCAHGAAVSCTASDQCHVAGTCNPATGTCSNPAAADGTLCSDGNLCFTHDSCQAGACSHGTPVTCTASDQCHVAGTCNPANGLCANPPVADGTACDDGNGCTLNDACQRGTCVGNGSVTCTSPDTCHTAGSCNPATGTCSAPAAKPDGAACSNGNACTSGDACQQGTCISGPSIICMAIDQCHAAGTCDPMTGICSTPAQPDGTACDDSNACTQSDVCQTGRCVGQNPVVCPQPVSQCQVAGTCNPATGVCSAISTAADGTPCNDGNACTLNDHCSTGQCSGTPVVCPMMGGVPGTCNPITGLCHYDQ